MEKLAEVVRLTWELLCAMAPYLLIGYLTAGLIHAFLPAEKIYRHLATGRLASVFKATLAGIPLPLCSCGVLPVAEMLRTRGATPGAVMAFLLSTPTTGVDSILATYSLLGLPITLLRIAAASTAGVVSGILANLLGSHNQTQEAPVCCCCCGGEATEEKRNRLLEALRYGFSQLMLSTRKWIITGIVIGGLIGALLPNSVVELLMRHNLSYLAVLLIAIPTYVCATGSVPIAASLVMKGFSPGSAIIFLVAGPASNTVSISFVQNRLGTRALAVYIITIVLVSLGFAVLADRLLFNASWQTATQAAGALGPVNVVAAAVLLLLFALAGRW